MMLPNSCHLYMYMFKFRPLRGGGSLCTAIPKQQLILAYYSGLISFLVYYKNKSCSCNCAVSLLYSQFYDKYFCKCAKSSISMTWPFRPVAAVGKLCYSPSFTAFMLQYALSGNVNFTQQLSYRNVLQKLHLVKLDWNYTYTTYYVHNMMTYVSLRGWG